MSREERAFGRQFKQRVNNVSYDYSKVSTTELKAMKRNNKTDREMVQMINRELIYRNGR